MNHFIYITTNLLNGKQYIGDHSCYNPICDNYLGSGIYINKAIKKFGKENFKREILESFNSKEEAFNAQEKYIKLYKTHVSQGGYNISWKGGHQCSKSVSIETRLKMSQIKTGKKRKPFSEEHKLKLKQKNSHRLIAYNRSKEGREMVSKLFKGKKKFFSEEHKINIGKASKGRKIPGKSIVIINKKYDSLHEASRKLKIPLNTIRHRLLSKNFRDWYYTNE
jgi:group I intron endonuclease